MAAKRKARSKARTGGGKKKGAVKKAKTARKAAGKSIGRKAPAKKKAATARKAPKKAAAKKPAPARKAQQIVGEGDYQASRTFLKDQAGFVKRNKARIPAMGKEAEQALDGPEGEALRAAAAKARARSRAPEGETDEPGEFVIPS